MATCFTALGPVTMSMYTPAMPELAAALTTTPSLVQLTLTVYLVGFAGAQLVYGPFSDAMGRRPVLIAGLGLYVAASAAASLVTGIWGMMAARSVQALGACAGPAMARAIVRDLFGEAASARVYALIGMAISVAPAIGPLLGGHMQGWFGWRSIFQAQAAFGVVLLAGVLLGLKESNLHHRVRRLSARAVVRNYLTVAGSRVFLAHAALIACALGGLLTFVAAAPFVLIRLVGLSPGGYGWVAFGITVAYFAGSVTTNRTVGALAPTGCCVSALWPSWPAGWGCARC